MPTISGVNGSDQLVDDGGDGTQPDGGLHDLQNIILDHDATHNDNNFLHTGGKLQEAASAQMALGTSEGDEVQSDAELLTPAINVNECLKPKILTWCARPSTGLPRSARAFNNVACLRQVAQQWCPDTSEYVEDIMDSLTEEEFDTLLPNEEALRSFTVWATHQLLRIRWATSLRSL